MGADMLVSCIYYLGNEQEEEGVRKMYDYVKSLDDDTLMSMDWEELFQRNPDFEVYFDEDAEIPYVQNTFKAKVMNILEQFEEVLGSRFVTWIFVPGCKIILTGGMSWGDAPTDDFYILEYVNSFPEEILNKGNFSAYPNATDIFFSATKNKLPERLKKDIQKWIMAEEV